MVEMALNDRSRAVSEVNGDKFSILLIELLSRRKSAKLISPVKFDILGMSAR